MITNITIAQGHIWLNFQNGLTLSIFNGFGSYTENYDKDTEYMNTIKKGIINKSWSSQEVELAVIDSKNSTFKTKEALMSNDNVLGNVEVSKLPKIIETVGKYKTTKEEL